MSGDVDANGEPSANEDGGEDVVLEGTLEEG
jgi:hypothetical protein